MTKMPKRLSLSRGVSSSGSMKSLDWQHRTSERSGSSILAQMQKIGLCVPENRKISKVERFCYENGKVKTDDNGKPIPVDPLESKKEIILNKIKREKRRVAKLKGFGTPPTGRETSVDKEREAKILRKEGIINRLLFELQGLNDYKQMIDVREDHKKLNKDAVQKGILVKLVNGDYVPAKKDGGVLIPHRNVVMRSFEKLTQTEQNRLAEKSRTEMKEFEIVQRKQRLKRLSMSELVKQETIRHKKESDERIQMVETKLKEAFSDDDFEKMFDDTD